MISVATEKVDLGSLDNNALILWGTRSSLDKGRSQLTEKLKSLNNRLFAAAPSKRPGTGFSDRSLP
jgi:hypothetical protein